MELLGFGVKPICGCRGQIKKAICTEFYIAGLENELASSLKPN